MSVEVEAVRLVKSGGVVTRVAVDGDSVVIERGLQLVSRDDVAVLHAIRLDEAEAEFVYEQLKGALGL